jgi:uncharacterized protein YyaL (SSP411 family)
LPLIRDVPAAQLSPYLRQHTANPVDWYTWGDDAFDRALGRGRPIFLSIGYSACHWCHVMAHESFEDPAVAEVLNASFVSIKVDREERPDVDAVYMEAVQALTGSGGWPMSMFLTPDRRPFFGGTYFPPADRPGLPGFRSVLDALTDVWDNRRDEVEEQADELSRAIGSRSEIHRPDRATSLFASTGLAPGADRPDLVATAVEELGSRFDPRWGGFGGAPKFPQPGLVDLALSRSLRGEADPTAAQAEQMAVTTLDAMAAGGIHDHLGGGFARYSTDVEWLVPHFEKMLYDQAGLLRAFLHGWQVTGRAHYLDVVSGIIGYVDRDLTNHRGGVYSAEDADSEGVEGRFYVWSPEQIANAVADGLDGRSSDGHDRGVGATAMTEALVDWFGVTDQGNFEGTNILRRPVGAPLRGDALVESGRQILLAARGTRTRPGLDDKVLTEWNAMYGSALAEAAAATGDKAWAESAVAIGQFLCDHLVASDGRWLRSWQPDSGARHLAYAGDYAWLVDCFTRLGELTGHARWTERATETADALLELFHDRSDGGFFTTGHDAEPLIVRTKDVFDGATASANAVAAMSLARLAALTGTERYADAAREVVDLLGDLLTRHPTAFALTVLTATHLMEGWTEVVITGSRPDLLGVVRSRWLPGSVLAWGEPTPSPLWQDRDPDMAYVCRNHACRLPAGDVDTLTAQLSAELR